MKTEDSEVTSDEILLRLVWHHFFKLGPPVRVALRAFHPKSLEIDGISLFRLACLNDAQECLVAIIKSENRTLNGIVGLGVDDIYKLGLSILPSPNPRVAGHVVLPELNSNSWAVEKPIWHPVVEALAELSRNNILHYPST